MSSIVKGSDGRYYKPCPECNEMQSYLRKNYAKESLRLKKVCKKCSNRKTENCHRGWHRGIRVSWFNKFKVSAETRGLGWTLTIDDVADLYEKQKGKCALTGWDITFPELGHPSSFSCSIDRIENKAGYTKENIQLVDGRLNMIKGKYTQQFFVEVCQAVAEHTKVKW
jgi:hypothetical protein